MAVVGKAWNRLTLPGKLVFTLVPLLILLTVGAVVLIVLAGPLVLTFLTDNLPLVRFLVAATAVLLMTVPTAFVIIYMEMKVIALMNSRVGPDRVGPYGSLLSVVHGLKVLDEGGLHADRGRRPGLHPRAGRRLPRKRPVAPRHPVRAGAVRPGHEHRRSCTSSRSAVSPSSA